MLKYKQIIWKFSIVLFFNVTGEKINFSAVQIFGEKSELVNLGTSKYSFLRDLMESHSPENLNGL